MKLTEEDKAARSQRLFLLALGWSLLAVVGGACLEVVPIGSCKRIEFNRSGSENLRTEISLFGDEGRGDLGEATMDTVALPLPRAKQLTGCVTKTS